MSAAAPAFLSAYLAAVTPYQLGQLFVRVNRLYDRGRAVDLLGARTRGLGRAARWEAGLGQARLEPRLDLITFRLKFRHRP